MIAENQNKSRRQLSRQICERLNWRSANGKLKEMMNRYHYLGSGPLCGHQMRYLIEKDVFVYPLDKEYKEELCKGMPEKVVEEEADWPGKEFSKSKLGDQRRVERLITIARDFYARPQANIPQACGSRAKTKAAYRFPESESVTMEKISDKTGKRDAIYAMYRLF